MSDEEPARSGGTGGAGGQGGAGEPRGAGGAGGQGGQGGTGGLAGDSVQPPQWWDDWWRRFRSADLRGIRIVAWLYGCVALLFLVGGVITWVQQENTREEQVRSLRLLEAIDEREREIAADAATVADYVAELRARSDGDGDGNEAVASAVALIPRIALAIEQVTGEPLPELPAMTTTTAG